MQNFEAMHNIPRQFICTYFDNMHSINLDFLIWQISQKHYFLYKDGLFETLHTERTYFQIFFIIIYVIVCFNTWMCLLIDNQFVFVS